MAKDVQTRIKGYQIKKELGKSASAVVFQAEDRLGRDVAIKIFQPEEDIQTGAKSRTTHHRPPDLSQYLKHVNRMSRLSHAGIAEIYDFDADASGRVYQVTEFISGSPLSLLIRNVELELKQKLSIILQAAEALQFLHAAKPSSFVHGNVKPSNILVGVQNSVKLIDFGVLQARSFQSLNSGFPYLSPEHWHPPISPWGDLFSLGTVLFELLTGKTPFATEEDSAADAESKLLSLKPALSIGKFGDFPPGLAEIVTRILSRERKTGYASVEQFLHKLSMVLQLAAMEAGSTRAKISTGRAQSARAKGFAELGEKIAATVAKTNKNEIANTEEMELCRQARRLLEEGKLVEAVEWIAQALLAFPSSRRLKKLKQRADTVLEEQRLREHAENAKHIEQAAEIHSETHKEVEKQRLREHAESAKHKEAEEQRLRENAENAKHIEQAAEIHTETHKEAEAQRLRESAAHHERRAQVLLAAKERLAAGDSGGAIMILEPALVEFSGDSEFLALLKHAHQHAEKIEALLAHADGEQKAGRLKESRQLLDEVLSLDRTNTVALARRAALERAIPQERDVFAHARGLLEQGWLREASMLIAQAEVMAPGSARVKELKELAARVAEKQRMERASESVLSPQAKLKAGELSSAAEELDAALDKFPKEEVLLELRDRLDAFSRESESGHEEVTIAENTVVVERRAAGDNKQEATEVIEEKVLIEVVERDHSQSRSEVLMRAKEHVEARDYAGALVILETRMADFAEDAEFLALLQEVRTGNQRTAMEEKMKIAERYISEGQAESALQLIDELRSEYRDHERLDALAAEARMKLEEEERRHRRDEILLRAKRSLHQKDFAGAILIVEAGLGEFTADAEFLALLQEARSGHEQITLEKQIQVAERRISEGDAESALLLIDALRAEYRGHERLDALAADARVKLEEKQRHHRRDEILVQARKSLQEKDFSGAIVLVESALGEFTQDAELLALLQQAREGHEQVAIEEQVVAAEKRLAEGDAEGVLVLVEELQFRHPGHKRLEEVAEKARSVVTGKHRHHSRKETLARARERVKEKDYAGAVVLVESAVTELGGDAELLAVLEEARSGHREAALTEKINALERRITGDAGGALVEINDLLVECPGNARLKSLEEKARLAVLEEDRRRRRSEAVVKAKARMNALDYAGAIVLLETVLAEFTGDPELIALLQRAQSEQLLFVQKEKIDQVDRQITGGNPGGALVLIAELLTELPGDARLKSLEEKARLLAVEEERRQRHSKAVTDTQTKIKEKNFEGAILIAEAALAEFAGDAELSALLKEAESKRARVELDDKIKGFERQISGGDVAGALLLIEGLMSEFRDDVRLEALALKCRLAVLEKERKSSEVVIEVVKEKEVIVTPPLPPVPIPIPIPPPPPRNRYIFIVVPLLLFGLALFYLGYRIRHEIIRFIILPPPCHDCLPPEPPPTPICGCSLPHQPKIVGFKSQSDYRDIQVRIGGGSADDPPGKEGLANLVANLLVAGGAGRDAGHWRAVALPSVQVDKEFTTFTFRVRRGDDFQEYSNRVLIPIFSPPQVDKLTLKRARDQMRKQIESRISLRPTELGLLDTEALESVVFKYTLLASPSVGTREGIESDAITPRDIKTFYQNHYGNGNAAIAITVKEKDFADAEDCKVAKLLITVLPTGGPVNPPCNCGFNSRGPDLLVIEDPNGTSTDIRLAFSLMRSGSRGGREHDDYWPLVVAGEYLEERLGSLFSSQMGFSFAPRTVLLRPNHEAGAAESPAPIAGLYFDGWIRNVPNAEAYFVLKAATAEMIGIQLHPGAVRRISSEQLGESKRKAIAEYERYAGDLTRRPEFPFPHRSLFEEKVNGVDSGQVNAALASLQLENLHYVVHTREATAHQVAEDILADSNDFSKISGANGELLARAGGFHLQMNCTGEAEDWEEQGAFKRCTQERLKSLLSPDSRTPVVIHPDRLYGRAKYQIEEKLNFVDYAAGNQQTPRNGGGTAGR